MTANIIELPERFNPPRLAINNVGLPCQQADPDLWFSERREELNLAKAHCKGCRKREPCLASALERREPTGVWGGEIFEQGRIIESNRPRGRPRKLT
jgi:WhiB family redox-sensing transcriptional regulator